MEQTLTSIKLQSLGGLRRVIVIVDRPLMTSIFVTIPAPVTMTSSAIVG